MPDVTLLYFAQAEERCGCARETLHLPPLLELADLREQLGTRHPRLRELLPHCRFALDQSFASGALALREGSELAVIPPVSGG